MGDTVAQLTSDVAVWCNERPDNLRLMWKGTTLPGELALSDVEPGTTLQVVTRQRGGAKKPKGNKSRGKKKVKMSRLSYQEKKKLLDSRDPRNAEMTFQEFEEEMQDSQIDWVTEGKATQEEREYREEIAKSTETTYGNLRPCDKEDDSVRLMSITGNCLTHSHSVRPLLWEQV